MSSLQAQENLPPTGTLNAQGFAICPECYSRINCGTAGLANLALHQGKGTCKKAQQKRAKEEKRKNMSILTFLTTKATRIPSTVNHSKPIHSQKLSTTSTIILTPSVAPRTEDVSVSESVMMPVTSNFLEKLHNLIDKLPDTIPEATEYDKLAIFAGNPSTYDNPSLDGDDLWETLLNGTLKSVFGWGTEGDLESIIRRGTNGLDGLAGFVRHFVVKRGVSEGLFEGKMSHLLTKLEEMSVIIHFMCCFCLPMNSVTRSKDTTVPSPLAIAEPSSFIPKPSGKASSTVNVIDVDSFKSGSENILETGNLSNKLCKGYILVFPDGKSPHTCYPFALHDMLVLPWDYATQNSVMTLFAQTCTGVTGRQEELFESCRACRNLVKIESLQSIVNRIQHGTHENAGFAYHGLSGLHDLLYRKNKQIEFH